MVPVRKHCGEPHPRPVLPESYIMMIACPESRAAEVEPQLKAIVSAAGASWLPDWMRDHEWQDRFNPMKAKRLGPSIVPAEVIIPLSSLSTFFNRLDAMIRPPVVVEATVVKGEEVILLCIIPHDRRTLTFNLAFMLSLSILRLAKRLAAAPTHPAFSSVRKPGRSTACASSSGRITNGTRTIVTCSIPGKISGIWLMKIVITLALWFEPMVRVAGNMVRPSSERYGSPGPAFPEISSGTPTPVRAVVIATRLSRAL